MQLSERSSRRVPMRRRRTPSAAALLAWARQAFAAILHAVVRIYWKPHWTPEVPSRARRRSTIQGVRQPGHRPRALAPVPAASTAASAAARSPPGSGALEHVWKVVTGNERGARTVVARSASRPQAGRLVFGGRT